LPSKELIGLKFGDVVTAVASLTVIYILLHTVLLAVLVPVNSYWAPDVAGLVSVLLASLIVGYVFAVKIHEEWRIGAIGRIVVLSTVVLAFTRTLLLTEMLVVLDVVIDLVFGFIGLYVSSMRNKALKLEPETHKKQAIVYLPKPVSLLQMTS
jgi:hypothetical protein